MPGKLTDAELADLLSEAQIGVLSTVDDKARPEGSPIWFEARENKVYVHVGRSSKKARNVRANPYVSLTVDTRQAPYRGAILHGTAAEVRFDDAMHRRVAVHYLGKEAGDAYVAMTEGAADDSILLEITVTGRFTWDYGKGF
ncbi:MAG TPA: pyridoxamine 5'-phosphate oxidase family protein [Candidatus Binatia bacterium]|jgi:PPOX class probable F420-dependent enzyme